jgi:hypothetical protein
VDVDVLEASGVRAWCRRAWRYVGSAAIGAALVLGAEVTCGGCAPGQFRQDLGRVDGIVSAICGTYPAVRGVVLSFGNAVDPLPMDAGASSPDAGPR